MQVLSYDDVSYSKKDRIKDLVQRGAVVSGFLFSVIFASFLIAHYMEGKNEAKYGDFELVPAVATETPSTEWKVDAKGKSVLNSSVSIDINGDGRSDTDLYLFTNASNLSADDVYILDNIKQGSSLLIEGVATKDYSGKIIDVINPGNGVKDLDGRLVVDPRGPGYLDKSNLIMVNENQVRDPRRNLNARILLEGVAKSK